MYHTLHCPFAWGRYLAAVPILVSVSRRTRRCIVVSGVRDCPKTSPAPTAAMNNDKTRWAAVLPPFMPSLPLRTAPHTARILRAILEVASPQHDLRHSSRNRPVKQQHEAEEDSAEGGISRRCPATRDLDR